GAGTRGAGFPPRAWPAGAALPYDARLARAFEGLEAMRLLSWMAALALLGACAAKPVEEKSVPVTPAPAAPAASAPAAPASAKPASAKPVIGDCGLDLSAGNHSIRPGDDFFA